MKRQLKLNLYDLIKKNKEELLKDRSVVEKIEKRVEEKIMKQNINLIHWGVEQQFKLGIEMNKNLLYY